MIIDKISIDILPSVVCGPCKHLLRTCRELKCYLIYNYLKKNQGSSKKTSPIKKKIILLQDDQKDSESTPFVVTYFDEYY